MINIDAELRQKSMQTKMILQIHDELIFESPENEVEQAAILIKKVMESAVHLDVKTDVEVNFGVNWKEIH